MSFKTRSFAILFIFYVICAYPAYAGSISSISLAPGPEAFNPSVGPMEIRYTLNKTGHADVYAVVVDSDGTPVRYLNHDASQGFVSWDGMLDDGRAAPEGNYKIKIMATTGTISVPQFFLRLTTSFLSNGTRTYYYPYGPAVDLQGNMYVTDGIRDCVLKFDRHGNLLQKWGMPGQGEGQFNDPAGIAVDGSGNVYVVDSKNHRVQKFDRDGRYLLQFGSYGSGDGQFRNPSGIAADKEGNIYVADTRNFRVQYFDNNGSFLGKWGSEGSGEGSFDYPAGIAIDNNDIVYVTDMNNDRVQKFSPAGAYLGELRKKGGPRLVAPSGIMASDSGSLLLIDSGNRRLSECLPDGTCLRQEYAPDGSARPAGRTVGDIAFEIGNGNIARWSPMDNSKEMHVYITDRGCLHVISLSPLQTGSVASIVAVRDAIVDRTAPSINIKTPACGFSYMVNQKVPAIWEVTDSLSGVNATRGTAKSGAYIDTSVPGKHDFTLEATDRAGNTGTVTCHYYVLDYPKKEVTSPANSGKGTGGGSSPGSPSTPDKESGPVRAIVQLKSDRGTTLIQAEVADTSEAINKGLKNRKSMPGNRGMLFVFSGDSMHSFHMEDTYIPLDMIFINSDMKIVSIHENAEPLNPRPISSGAPCHYVLEVNAGVADESGIRVGDRVIIDWI